MNSKGKKKKVSPLDGEKKNDLQRAHQKGKGRMGSKLEGVGDADRLNEKGRTSTAMLSPLEGEPRSARPRKKTPQNQKGRGEFCSKKESISSGMAGGEAPLRSVSGKGGDPIWRAENKRGRESAKREERLPAAEVVEGDRRLNSENPFPSAQRGQTPETKDGHPGREKWKKVE